MARKVGQIVGRGRRTWLVRVYNGHDPETKKRKYLNQGRKARSGWDIAAVSAEEGRQKCR